jgi:hypothetical protein
MCCPGYLFQSTSPVRFPTILFLSELSFLSSYFYYTIMYRMNKTFRFKTLMLLETIQILLITIVKAQGYSPLGDQTTCGTNLNDRY